MIRRIGSVDVGWPLRQAANEIRYLSYKVNTPKRFQTHQLHNLAAQHLMTHLSYIAGVPVEKLDFVYFSVCAGAEEHVDELDLERFTDRTLVVPLILPSGVSTITADGVTMQVELDKVYEFNHQRPHRMDLEDTQSGCVVLMVAVLK
jgi:hypothetical protein